MNKLISSILLASCAIVPEVAFAEEPIIWLQRAHAHNDYEKTEQKAGRIPLLDALGHGFTSVEADIAHYQGDLRLVHFSFQAAGEDPAFTLRNVYLDPLRQWLKENGSNAPPLDLLIDFKSTDQTTWNVLREQLAEYPEIFARFAQDGVTPGPVTAHLSGEPNRDMINADPVRFAGYDGRSAQLINRDGTPAAPLAYENFYSMVSQSWTSFNLPTIYWNGIGEMPEARRAALADYVARAHANGMKVRFWNTPDSVTTMNRDTGESVFDPAKAAQREAIWSVLLEAGVDLINTDDLAGLQSFLLRKDPLALMPQGEVHASGQLLAHRSYESFAAALGTNGLPAGRRSAALEGGPSPLRAWINPLAGGGDINDSKFDWSAAGLAVGVDRTVGLAGGDLTYGAGVGYISSNATVSGPFGQASNDAFYGGLYADWTNGATALSANIAYGTADTSLTRKLSVAQEIQTAVADANASSFGFGLEASHGIPLGGVSLGPVATLDGVWTRHSGTTEDGAGDFNLQLDSASYWTLDGGIGLQASHTHALGNGGALTLTGRALWQHNFGDTETSRSMTSMAGKGVAFDSAGLGAGRDRLRAEAGFSFDPSAATSLSVNYSGTFSSSEQNHGISGRFSLRF